MTPDKKASRWMRSAGVDYFFLSGNHPPVIAFYLMASAVL